MDELFSTVSEGLVHSFDKVVIQCHFRSMFLSDGKQK